jgi:hypothetical protein
VELERLAVAVRPRGGWEALDLGFGMARQWWRPLWLVWLTLYVPTAVLLHFVLNDDMWLAMILLWWLHPLFERAVLHVVAHAVFDSPPTLRQTMAAAGDWLRPGWFAGLTPFFRFRFARSLMLPVWQLEKQRGRAASDRRTLLGKRLYSYGVWLSAVCVMFVYVLFNAFELLPAMLEPANIEDDPPDLSAWFSSSAESWGWEQSLCLAAAYSILGPFYVCAGFALYLNRRAALEGWDIEIALRKLAQRLGRAGPAVSTTLGVAALVFCGALFLGMPTLAQSTPQAPQQSADTPAKVIKEVLADPEFGTDREVSRLVPRFKVNDPEDKSDWRFLFKLGEVIANLAQVLVWVAAGIVVILLVRAALRYAGWRRSQSGEEYIPPAALFGLDLRPQSLPDDVSAAALALARAGQLREALSLLYRGALSALVHLQKVELAEGDTEEDCLQAAHPVLRGEGWRYFGELIDAWRSTAYAKRLPPPARIEQLCAEWNAHFRAHPGDEVRA